MKAFVHVLECVMHTFMMYAWECICNLPCIYKAVQVSLCISIYLCVYVLYVLSMSHLLSLAVVSEVVCQGHWQESEGG